VGSLHRLLVDSTLKICAAVSMDDEECHWELVLRQRTESAERLLIQNVTRMETPGPAIEGRLCPYCGC
jgi:hypothetical protein